MNIASSILDAIGKAPLVELHKVVPPGHAPVVVKLECENPTGSWKDRMARAIIGRAEAGGRLPDKQEPGSYWTHQPDNVDHISGCH